MQLLIWLLLVASPQFTRVASKQAPPQVQTRLVWVFFTDKGIFTDDQNRAATATLARAADPRVLVRRNQAPVAGFDFDDVPVREEYIRRIEVMGGRLRTVSRWLNAASFELAPERVPAIHALPFVYDIRPVAVRSEPVANPTFTLPRPASRALRALDTAEAHRFYGVGWDQARMMGVPVVAAKGYYGTGVRLAIFDTGLKLRNRSVQALSLSKQHDFISGDNFQTARSDAAWAATPVPNLRYLGFVRDPVVSASPPDSVSGQIERLILAFVADSFNYSYSVPQRGLFASRSTDRGLTWSDPELLMLSRPDNQTYENLTMARRGFVSYLALNEATELNGGGTAATIIVGWFVGADWYGSRNVGAGRWPHIATVADTLYLTYVFSDSVLVFNRAAIAMAEPAWGVPVQLHPGEPVTDPQVCPGPDGRVNLFCAGRGSGRIYRYESVDGGATFYRASDICPAGGYAPRVFGDGASRVLLFRDYRQPPFARLAIYRSTDYGATWTSAAAATQNTLTLGGYAAAFRSPQAVTLLYESAGLLFRRTTDDLGATWSESALLDTAGFCYQPCLVAPDTQTLTAVWFKRGDDNTVWEDSDTLRFSRDQSDHGTRMASIIAGWQPYTLVGVAPGVDLLVAKTELHKARSSRRYEYNMEEDTYIQALEWAEAMGADIISTSLGYRGWYRDDQFDGRTAPVSLAASLAAKRGVLVVTAMGNRDSTTRPWPRPYIVAPGDADGVLTAGGIERNGLPWRGTGTGPTADGRVKPDFVALSDTVGAASPDSTNAVDGSVGTSCATALIAGACALLKEAHPAWTADSIMAVLRLTSTIAVPGCTLGYGVPRIDSAFKLFPPDRDRPGIPRDAISLVFPSPFVPSRHPRVYFELSLTRNTPQASICIYTASGTLVDSITLNADLLNRPGRYGANGDIATLEQLRSYWDGNTAAGRPAAAGLYIAALQTTFGGAVTRFALVR